MFSHLFKKTILEQLGPFSAIIVQIRDSKVPSSPFQVAKDLYDVLVSEFCMYV